MKTKTKVGAPAHTPTPWEIPIGWDGHIFKDGGLLGKMSDCRTSSAVANADFIVRAVNSHATLLEIAKKYLEGLRNKPAVNTFWADKVQDTINRAEGRE